MQHGGQIYHYQRHLDSRNLDSLHSPLSLDPHSLLHNRALIKDTRRAYLAVHLVLVPYLVACECNFDVNYLFLIIQSSTPLSKSPRSSLYGRPIEDDQEAPPTTFLQDEENVYQQNTTTSAPSAQQIHNLTPWHHAPQPVRQQSPIESRSVTFYGMNDAIRARMMDIFIPQFGAIENVSDGINWIDVVFVDSLAAQRALKLSGKRVDELGGIMLGVKLTHQSDDQQSGFQGQQQQQFDNSKHLTPLPPSQAFKPSPKPQSSTTTLRTMFNTPNKSTNEYGITPEQADSQPNRQTIGGKIADLIFGF